LPTSATRTSKEIKDIVKGGNYCKIKKKSFPLKYYGHPKNCNPNECQNEIATATVEETKKKDQMRQ